MWDSDLLKSFFGIVEKKILKKYKLLFPMDDG